MFRADPKVETDFNVKRKMTTLRYFFILTLSLILSFETTFANENIAKEELTLLFSNYLDKLRTHCNFETKECMAMKEALGKNPPELINPISKETALILTTCYPYWNNFNEIIKVATPELFDYQKIHSNIKQTISQIRKNRKQREEARIKTENINIEMDFATIPMENYSSTLAYALEASLPIANHHIQLTRDLDTVHEVAIQTTPVTQYQWARVMGDNPSYFKTGEDSRQVKIAGKQMEMCPNRPVENVSYDDIIKFIKALNEQDSTYEYQLPSVEEYLAVIGNDLQAKGPRCLNKEETCPVETSSYYDLDDQHIYSISDNVLQFTRDHLARNDLPKDNKILFGSSYHSTDCKLSELSSVIQLPILYTKTSIGFRLIRHKKSDSIKPDQSYNLIEDKESAGFDKMYAWDNIYKIYILKEEFLDWMINNLDKYPEQIQHTIKELLKIGSAERLRNVTALSLANRNISDLTPLAGLINLVNISLNHNNISNIAPLAGLTNLEYINLHQNKISDITPLASLKELHSLDLDQNNISDITSLAGLTKLVYLSLGENKISDITPLADLTNLKYLYLNQNNISNVTTLANLTNLKFLELSQNNISDIAPLTKLLKFKSLDMTHNQIKISFYTDAFLSPQK